MVMKRGITKTVLGGLVVAGVVLAGCASNGGDAQKAADTDATTADTTITHGKASEVDGTTATTDVTEAVEATEWLDAKDSAEAVTKAGLTGEFSVPDEVKVGDMTFKDPTFTYTDNIVRAVYEQPACMIEIRKSHGPAGTVVPDDTTGMMGENFAESWEITPGGLPMTCHGDKKGEAVFVQWYNKVDPTKDGEDDAYSILITGLGGEDVPMTDDEVGDIATAVK